MTISNFVNLFTKDEALNSNVDCILSDNPGYNILKRDINRFRTDFIFAFGPRGSGKTAVLESLQIPKENASAIDLEGIVTYTTREKRDSEHLGGSTITNIYFEGDESQRIAKFFETISREEIGVAYRYQGVWYGIPSKLNLRPNSTALLLTISPLLVNYMLSESIFPNAVNVQITADKDSLKRRLESRYAIQEPIENAELKEKKIVKILDDADLFKQLIFSPDLCYLNNDPFMDNQFFSTNPTQGLFGQRKKPDIIATRLRQYFDIYKIVDDKENIQWGFIKTLFAKLFPGGNIDQIISSLSYGYYDKVLPKEYLATAISSYTDNFRTKFSRDAFQYNILPKKGCLMSSGTYPGSENKLEFLLPYFIKHNRIPRNRRNEEIYLSFVTHVLGEGYLLEENGIGIKGVSYGLSDHSFIKNSGSPSSKIYPAHLYISFRARETIKNRKGNLTQIPDV